METWVIKVETELINMDVDPFHTTIAKRLFQWGQKNILVCLLRTLVARDGGELDASCSDWGCKPAIVEINRQVYPIRRSWEELGWGRGEVMSAEPRKKRRKRGLALMGILFSFVLIDWTTA